MLYTVSKTDFWSAYYINLQMGFGNAKIKAQLFIVILSTIPICFDRCCCDNNQNNPTLEFYYNGV